MNADFLDYSEFNDVNLAYSDFIKKLLSVINTCAPIRERRIKIHSQVWYVERL